MDTDLAFSWLCKELENGAEQGHIFQLKDVWNRYVEHAEEMAIVTLNHSLVGEQQLKKNLKAKMVPSFNFSSH